MALTHSEKTVSSLKINKVPSKAVYQKMIDQGLINNDELYLVQEPDASIINKFTFTATKGQQTFIIPFEFADSKALTVYYNGVMMKEPENYTISGKVITLVNWTAEAGDYLTVMGIEGAVAIDVDARVQEIQDTVDDGKVSIQNAVNQARTTVEQLKKQIDELKKQIPDDVTKAVYKNTINAMEAGSKITMDSKYVPSNSYDVATKKYVDEHVPEIDPAVGTTTRFSIYIGTTAPAAGTTPLLWIDTSSSGTFKYRTDISSTTWTPVPVAWG